jgi:hypothetical protein
MLLIVIHSQILQYRSHLLASDCTGIVSQPHDLHHDSANVFLGDEGCLLPLELRKMFVEPTVQEINSDYTFLIFSPEGLGNRSPLTPQLSYIRKPSNNLGYGLSLQPSHDPRHVSSARDPLVSELSPPSKHFLMLQRSISGE